MKRYLRCCLYLFVMAGMTPRASAQTSEPPPFAFLQNQYQLAQDQLGAEQARKRDKLKIDYSRALGKAGDSAKAAGNLDLVLAIKNEVGRVVNDAKPTAEERNGMSKPLADLRTQFETADLRLADEYAARQEALTARYIQNLDVLEKKLTAGNDIDGAILVRSEKDRISGKTPAPEGAEQDAWKNDWKNSSNWGADGRNVVDNWVDGDMKPGAYENIPPYDASRKGIMSFHPFDANTPAVLRYDGIVSARRPILSVQAAGNVRGDCALNCVVDGKQLDSVILDGKAWKTCHFDLTAYAGRKVTIDLQIASGGSAPWFYEHGFIDRIEFVQAGAPPAESARPAEGEVELLAFVDDGCEVYLNGTRIEVVSGKVSKLRVDTGDVLAVKAWDVQGGTAGGLALSLTQSNGKKLKTDTRWKCSAKEEPGWKDKTFEDKEWDRAHIVDIGWIADSLKRNYQSRKPLIIWGKGGTVYFRRVIKPEVFD